MASFAEASQAPQPPAPKDAGAPGHKAPARGDKGFNSWVNTDDSFDKYRRGMAGGWGGGGGQSFPAHSLSLVLCCLSSCLGNLSFLYFVFFFLQPLSVCFLQLSPPLSSSFSISPLSLYPLYPVLCEFGSDRRSSPRSAFLFIPYL